MTRKAKQSVLNPDEREIDAAFGYLVNVANSLREIAEAAEAEGNRLAEILERRGYRLKFDGTWRKIKAK